MSDLVAAEHRDRTDGYRVSEQTYDLLRKMNEALRPLESYPEDTPTRPILFIFGLPRSGTTLLSQVLSYCLDIGYIDGIAARFWLAPMHGLAVSRAVLAGRRDGSFRSDLGKSVSPAGPHEFSYFWQHWLGMRSVDDLVRFDRARSTADWAGLRRLLAAMQAHFESPLLFKTNLIANHLDEVPAQLPTALFVYIERDPESVCQSILRARRAYYGNADRWWATYPPDYHELTQLPFDEQIACQVRSLREVYHRKLAEVPADRQLRLGHDELCRAPNEVVQRVRGFLSRFATADVREINPPPSPFPVRRHAPVDEAEERVVDAWRRLTQEHG